MVTISATSARRRRWVGWSYRAHILLSFLFCLYVYLVYRPTGVGLQVVASWLAEGLIVSSDYSGSAFWVYSLPCSVWIFGLSLLGVIWRVDGRGRASVVGLLPVGMALGMEAMQYCGWTDGTFDPWDLAAVVLGYVGAVAFVRVHGEGWTLQGREGAWSRWAYLIVVGFVVLGDVW